MSRKYQRKSAAQKDALLPSVETSEVKESLRLSAAQKDGATSTIVTDLATELLDSTLVQPKPKPKPKPKKSKSKQGFAASFEKKKSCNDCPD